MRDSHQTHDNIAFVVATDRQQCEVVSATESSCNTVTLVGSVVLPTLPFKICIEGGGEAVKQQQIKSLAGVKWEPRFCRSCALHCLVYGVIPAQSRLGLV